MLFRISHEEEMRAPPRNQFFREEDELDDAEEDDEPEQEEDPDEDLDGACRWNIFFAMIAMEKK
jgi:hypothetical protein